MSTKKKLIVKVKQKLQLLNHEEKEELLLDSLKYINNDQLKLIVNKIPQNLNEQKVPELHCDQFFPVNNISIFNVFPNKCGVENCQKDIKTVNKWIKHLKKKHALYKIQNSIHYKSYCFLFLFFYMIFDLNFVFVFVII